jgi:hypothetical protein
MKKGLGNNPLQNGDQDTLIRSTEGQPASAESKTGQTATVKPGQLVPKSMQLDSLLNERLRRYAYESRKKEAQIFREALHKYLAENGF